MSALMSAIESWKAIAVREALYQAAHVMLTKPLKGCSQLKSWAVRLAKRAGMNKAKVALARKLAVIMHRMLADGKPALSVSEMRERPSSCIIVPGFCLTLNPG